MPAANRSSGFRRRSSRPARRSPAGCPTSPAAAPPGRSRPGSRPTWYRRRATLGLGPVHDLLGQGGRRRVAGQRRRCPSVGELHLDFIQGIGRAGRGEHQNAGLWSGRRGCRIFAAAARGRQARSEPPTQRPNRFRIACPLYSTASITLLALITAKTSFPNPSSRLCTDDFVITATISCPPGSSITTSSLTEPSMIFLILPFNWFLH